MRLSVRFTRDGHDQGISFSGDLESVAKVIQQELWDSPDWKPVVHEAHPDGRDVPIQDWFTYLANERALREQRPRRVVR